MGITQCRCRFIRSMTVYVAPNNCNVINVKDTIWLNNNVSFLYTLTLTVFNKKKSSSSKRCSREKNITLFMPGSKLYTLSCSKKEKYVSEYQALFLHLNTMSLFYNNCTSQTPRKRTSVDRIKCTRHKPYMVTWEGSNLLVCLNTLTSLGAFFSVCV